MATKRKQTQTVTGRVEIRMVNPKRTGTITVRDYSDKNTGALREFKDSHGNPRVKRYTKATTILDLSNEDDRLEYLHTKDHPIFVLGAHPCLKVIDVVQQAEDDVESMDLGVDALIVARELRSEKMVNFARVLGIGTHNVLESIIKKRVYEYAQNKPKEFMAAWDNPNRMFSEILHKGKTVGVFNANNGVWKYRETLMGVNIDEAILWLKNNEDLLPNIRKELTSAK